MKSETGATKTPYETPRLEIVELRPEEQLLACIKFDAIGPPPCVPMFIS